MNLRLQPSLVHSNGLMPEMELFFFRFSLQKPNLIVPKWRMKIWLMAHLCGNEDVDRDDLTVCILCHTLHINTVERCWSLANFVIFPSLNEPFRNVWSEQTRHFQKVDRIFHRNTHFAPICDCTAFGNVASSVWSKEKKKLC